MVRVCPPLPLRRNPLPQPSHEGDKDARGRILVIAGAGEMPGAALLSAVAALRAGAGKLQVATCASAAPLVAAAVPESRVVALPETRTGALATSARGRIEAMSEHADAIVVGPGLLESAATARMLAAWLAELFPELDGDATVLARVLQGAIYGFFMELMLLAPEDRVAHLTRRADEIGVVYLGHLA